MENKKNLNLNERFELWEKSPDKDVMDFPIGPLTDEQFGVVLDKIGIPDMIDVTENLKKVALISTFCDTPEKLDVLRNNVKIIKSLGVDVICISPFLLDYDVIKYCDYFLLTKDNPVLNWPLKAIGIWKQIQINNKIIRLSVTYPDHGFAGLYHVKQLSQLAMNLDYNQFYHLIYDTKIDNIVQEAFKSNLKNSIFGSKRDSTIWPAGLHLMVFDKTNLEKLVNEITLESYLENKSNDAFVWLHNIARKYNFTIENKHVEDYIKYNAKYDFFNVSPLPSFKMFIYKNAEMDNNVSLYFYDVNTENVEIYVEDTKITNQISNDTLYDLGFKKDESRNVYIISDNIKFDITVIINELKHSTYDNQ